MIALPLFGFFALLTVGSALIVSFSRSIVYSGFALLGTFFGAAGFYLFLSSDFVAVTQVLIYVGGVLVLILFAIMLTNKIEDATTSNPSLNRIAGAVLTFVLFLFLVGILSGTDWVVQDEEKFASMVTPIGNALLSSYLLPFEVISIALLAALLGAVVLVRREVR
ncbi:MAG: NADH-quinone oxidoreductase subunit J [Deltaproteobacteria bacterium]|nr:NADH-quinone oxidoreductase subunit J [Deltaproteobacteria bacterium]